MAGRRREKMVFNLCNVPVSTFAFGCFCIENMFTYMQLVEDSFTLYRLNPEGNMRRNCVSFRFVSFRSIFMKIIQMS